MHGERIRPGRRRFLTTAGVVTTSLVAGCLSDSNNRESDTPSEQTRNQTSDPGDGTTDDSDEETTDDSDKETSSEADQVVESFEAYTTALETVKPDQPRQELDFLQDDLADASIVGMGEATHGTREFFQFKDRLVRYLAEELGLRAFAWEAGFGATRTVDRYIRRGDGDAESALQEVGYWIWDVESVREMVEWMRGFNEGRAPDDKIRFYGVDTQSPSGELNELQSFFDAVDDDFLDSRSDSVELFRSGTLRADESALEQVRGFVPALQDHLETNETAFVAATSRHEYEFARRHARLLEQRIEYITAWHQEQSNSSTVVRNESMAENTRWVLEREGLNQLALWMHNSHINQNKRVDTGGILADWYGDDYYTVGMEFGHGSFQAIEITDEGPGGLERFTLEPAPEDTLPGVLSKLEMPNAFVDLDAASGDEQLTQWLAEPPRRTVIGGGFSEDEEGLRFSQDTITGDFDGLLFVEETERARPL